MNLLRKINVTVFPLLISQFANAQQVYPAVVTNNGILFGKYRTANDATNPLPDTISLEEAKSIIAINAIYVDKEQKLSRIKILDYQMTIFEKGDTSTIKNNSEVLSSVMKERLDKVKSGAKLFFEGIKADFSNGESRMAVILSFIVI